MKKENWFSMGGKDKFLFGWVILSFIILYGPWGWSGEDGSLSVLFYTSTIMLILIPLVATIVLVMASKEDK